MIFERNLEKYICFVPASWDELRMQNLLHTVEADKWLKSGRSLYFIFVVSPKSVEIAVQIRYGTPEQQKRLIDIARKHPQLFNCYRSSGGGKYIDIYQNTIFSPNDLESEPLDIFLQKLQDWWMNFSETDLKEIERVFVAGLQTPV